MHMRLIRGGATHTKHIKTIVFTRFQSCKKYNIKKKKWIKPPNVAASERGHELLLQKCEYIIHKNKIATKNKNKT